MNRHVLIFSELVSEGLLRLRDDSLPGEDGTVFDEIARYIFNEIISWLFFPLPAINFSTIMKNECFIYGMHGIST